MGQTVEKEFKWEMAHRLVGFDWEKEKPVNYCDNCKNLHGHSYTAVVKMSFIAKNPHDQCLDEFGMLYDYNKMKKLKKWIDDNLDHCVMVSSFDKDLLKFVKSQKGRDKHFVVETPSTAENICKIIFDVASEMLDDERAQVCEVRVKETATSEATYTDN